MANILLIEPDYKCKYPPLGIMKIAYYHKEVRRDKGDIVWFSKGKLPEKISDNVRKQLHQNKYYRDRYQDKLDEHIDKIDHIIANNLWDRVYVCTLFTFEYQKTFEAIEYAKTLVGKENVYTGGILATLMPDKLKRDTGVIVNTGQLTDSKDIGYDDKVNIDILTPDYSILDNTEYRYENEDAYYAYATRGCGMKCGFCAVQTLEPEYKPFISIKEQIREVARLYGEKKDLLLMDNNVLRSHRLEEIIEEIEELGFKKGATYINPRTGKEKRRFVDFNQGLDAFLMTEKKAELLGRVAIRPARIAFDHIEDAEIYKRAIRRAAQNGITHLSNYLLYNSEAFSGKGHQYSADSPADLYNRLKINVHLQEELNKDISKKEDKIHIFSFPMRYIPLDGERRGYVGTNWNKKYLRAIQTILIPTQGKGVSGKSFFEAAFGESEKEFLEVILMPESYIATRGTPEKIKNISDVEMTVKQATFKMYEKLRAEWKNIYSKAEADREILTYIIGENNFTYKEFKKLPSKESKKVFIHYLTIPGMMGILEEAYMNNDEDAIETIKAYITKECRIMYENLIDYMVTTNNIQRRLERFNQVFEKQGLKDLILKWISKKCDNSNFVVQVSNSLGIAEASLWALSWGVRYAVLTEQQVQELVTNIVGNNNAISIRVVDSILDRVEVEIGRRFSQSEAEQIVNEMKKAFEIQLSLF